MASGIKIENLTKSFSSAQGIKTPIKDLSLEIRENELTTVIGKSGCGKTTLLKLLSGIEIPDSGTIRFYDKNGKTIEDPKVSYVFQEPRLLPWKTVGENLELPIREKDSQTRKQLIKEALDLVCLDSVEDLYPSELSGGMAQRVGLARGVISKPDILLLDEPFSALDFLTRTKLQSDFSRLQKELSMTMLMITHDINEAVFLGNRVLYLNGGKIEKDIGIDVETPRQIGDNRLLTYQNLLLNSVFK